MGSSSGVDPNTLPVHLDEWVARQRWYGAKGSSPRLRSIGAFPLRTTDAGVSIRTHLLLDTTGSAPVLYQVPLVWRDAPLTGAEPALVGTVTDAAGRQRSVYDGPQDRAYTSALLRLVLGRESGEGGQAAAVSGRAIAGDTAALTPVSSRVLTGEQSNTSIIYELVDGAGEPVPPVICKVFRALHHGENPDVAVQVALTSAGSPFVPRLVGYATGEWADPGRPSGRATGHLAFAQEYLPGVEDAWRVALRAARAGNDFSAGARALGEATARVHATLAEVMPTAPATSELVAQMVAGMRRRLAVAVQEVPELAAFSSAIDAVFDDAEATQWPPLQRIHGDFHLGQVLFVPERGWVLLDFEGEPLRPMDERTRPDLPLRDVAGMLRSFAYVAGEIALSDPQTPDPQTPEPQTSEPDAVAWADAARNGFLDGYAAVSGRDPRDRRALLSAFELDKAVYETIYESRNRPQWLPIPLLGIRRLIGSQ